MISICPFCNEKLISTVVNASSHFIASAYDGIKYKKILSYACHNKICENTLKVSKGYKYFLDVNEQKEPVYTGILFPLDDRTYAYDYIFPVVQSNINMIFSIAKLNPKSKLKYAAYTPLLKIKYPYLFDMDNPIAWGEKALNKLLKLTALY